MKSLRKLAVALAAGLISTAVLAEEELIVATDTAFVPFEYKEGDKYVGFDIDLWDAIAQRIGVKYKLQPMDFNGIIPGLQTGQIDVAIAGMTIKEDRKEVIDFSDGYYDSGFLLMVPMDSDVQGPEDMAGKVLAAKTGTATVDYAKENMKDTELRLFPVSDNAYLEVVTGRVDGAMHDTPNVLYYIKTNGQGKVRAAGKQVMAHEYGIGFPKGSPLVSKVNAALAEIKNDGTYAELYMKWFGSKPPAK